MTDRRERLEGTPDPRRTDDGVPDGAVSGRSPDGLAGTRSDGLATLVPLLYGDLRALAARRLRHECARHSLQPTALVHETFLRLAPQEVSYLGRTHVLALAAQQMRRILIDHARRRQTIKRGRSFHRITLTDEVALLGRDPVDILALEQALEKLEALDPPAAEVVACRFYGGMTEAEIGEKMGISERWVRMHWAHARAWLRREMDG